MTSDTEILSGLSYLEMQQVYSANFSLGCILGGIQNKFFLIGSICRLTHLAKQKAPGITHWHIILKLTQDLHLPERFLMGLAILCDDFAYESKDFPTFGVEDKDVIPKIKEILKNYMPF